MTDRHKELDQMEALANPIAGLAISWGLVEIIRAVGLWDAHALIVSGFFFIASTLRSYFMRRFFRRLNDIADQQD